MNFDVPFISHENKVDHEIDRTAEINSSSTQITIDMVLRELEAWRNTAVPTHFLPPKKTFINKQLSLMKFGIKFFK